MFCPDKTARLVISSTTPRNWGAELTGKATLDDANEMGYGVGSAHYSLVSGDVEL